MIEEIKAIMAQIETVREKSDEEELTAYLSQALGDLQAAVDLSRFMSKTRLK